MTFETINNIDWDSVSVKLDGTVINEVGDELDIDEIEQSYKSLVKRLRAMVSAATANYEVAK